MHPETVCVSNALTREAGVHSSVRPGGGHFNELLPADLHNTDACSSQPETVARVKITKLSTMPENMGPDSAFA